jgi:hypothetical protein
MADDFNPGGSTHVGPGRKENGMNSGAPASREVPVCAGPAVPPHEWAGFCNTFGRMHRGWLVTLAMLDSAELHAGAQPGGVVLARELPLESMMVVHRDREVELSVTVRTNGRRLSYPVRQPERLMLEQAGGGVHEGLCIAAANGQTLRVSFRVPAAPECLDGLADAER